MKERGEEYVPTENIKQRKRGLTAHRKRLGNIIGKCGHGRQGKRTQGCAKCAECGANKCYQDAGLSQGLLGCTTLLK